MDLSSIRFCTHFQDLHHIDITPSGSFILLSSFIPCAILLTFSVNTFCAALLNFCWGFHIVFLLPIMLEFPYCFHIAHDVGVSIFFSYCPKCWGFHIVLLLPIMLGFPYCFLITHNVGVSILFSYSRGFLCSLGLSFLVWFTSLCRLVSCEQHFHQWDSYTLNVSGLQFFSLSYFSIHISSAQLLSCFCLWVMVSWICSLRCQIFSRHLLCKVFKDVFQFYVNCKAVCIHVA